MIDGCRGLLSASQQWRLRRWWHLVWPNLKIDFVTVALLSIACLPWLHGIVSGVDLPGGTSIKLAARQRAVAREQQETIEAVRAVVTADKTVPPHEKLAKIYELAEDYERLRAIMPSGHQRTQTMGRIARQILSYMPLDRYDPDADLLSPKAGRRLVAYLSLVADPDPSRAEELTRTLTEREGIPYNQSWALRALNRIVDTHGGEIISGKALNCHGGNYVLANVAQEGNAQGREWPSSRQERTGSKPGGPRDSSHQAMRICTPARSRHRSSCTRTPSWSGRAITQQTGLQTTGGIS
jgi:hypothetical protein